PAPSPQGWPVRSPCTRQLHPRGRWYEVTSNPTSDSSRHTWNAVLNSRRHGGTAMRTRTWTPILVLALAAGCGPCGYNRIVQEEQQVEAAWSQVENQLQRRADLIPNLVEVV